MEGSCKEVLKSVCKIEGEPSRAGLDLLRCCWFEKDNSEAILV
ncbi:MAG: hypothetical protein ABGX39_05685 [Methylococcales bacterium]